MLAIAFVSLARGSSPSSDLLKCSSPGRGRDVVVLSLASAPQLRSVLLSRICSRAGASRAKLTAHTLAQGLAALARPSPSPARLLSSTTASRRRRSTGGERRKRRRKLHGLSALTLADDLRRQRPDETGPPSFGPPSPSWLELWLCEGIEPTRRRSWACEQGEKDVSTCRRTEREEDGVDERSVRGGREDEEQRDEDAREVVPNVAGVERVLDEERHLVRHVELDAVRERRRLGEVGQVLDRERERDGLRTHKDDDESAQRVERGEERREREAGAPAAG